MGDGKHFLGTFVAEFPDARAVWAVREINEEEYRDYAEDVRRMLACRSDYRQFTMVRHAYVEYARELRRYEGMLAGPVRLDEIMEDDLVHTLNRRLRGFFSEMRIFLDNTRAKLKRRFGKGSEELRAFDDACARQFDGSFAYRLIYGLRNYAVHVNLPLNAVSLVLGQGAFDTGDPSTHNRLRVEIDKDTLLREFDWRRDVRPGLESLPTRFELGPYMDEAMACLEKIHLELFCAKLPGEQRAAGRLLALARSAGGRGTPCVFRVGGEDPLVNSVVLKAGPSEHTPGEEPGGSDVFISWIPVEVASMVVGLPEAEEIQTHEYIDWQITDLMPQVDAAEASG